ncbi:hypothetical protein BDN72DRAFT_871195 [Pluteus cervinus]|uniref:Uncharacterized protein n=1 Tax=Pluteus cervinus TaxID=181527 RepID=A0ACD3APY6_9AGAR|nr:hypothetical protein BDN72DRAFT_871195 [Pluteus cervinus]
MELVCIGWRPYVLEVCAEHLVLHTEMELAITLRKLRNKDPKGRPYGERTKRIDFSFLRPRYCIEGVIELFQCTPNLLIYVNANISDPLPEQQTPTEIIQALVKHCGQSLRRAEWAGEGESPAFLDLDILASGAPNLHTLHLRCIYSYARNHDSKHPILAFPNLKTLSLGLIPTCNEALPPRPSTWDLFLALLCLNPIQLPSLERLEVDIFPDLFFLVTHGSKIRYLRTTSWSFASVLQTALPLCINLDTLVISQTTNKLKFPSSHPSLNRICILPHVEQYVLVPERVFTYAVLEPLDDLFLGLEAMTAPELKEIRIRNIGGFTGILTRKIWLEGWWQRWKEHNVALTDKRGHPFEAVKKLPF